MKRKIIPTLLALALTAALIPSVLAAVPPTPCYPTSVTRSEDGAQIRKVYDLGPSEDPAGIPRSDFEQEGFHYTLTDLLKQEAPEREERFHTETVTLDSKSKDMESVLALLPAQREFTTEDGLTGTLNLKLDTVNVEVSGYGSTTKAVSVSRSYPNLSSQDTSYIPKEITDNGRTLELASIDWQTDNTANEDGYAVADRYTAIATYTGSATSSYIKGYVVTAEYSGTVSRIALNKVRYVAIFEGTPLVSVEPEPTPEPPHDVHD
ncbi:MAG: cell wall anchor protein, partial [Oscillospiraceae bacterium]